MEPRTYTGTMHGSHSGEAGVTVLLVIAFMGIFLLILSGIAGFALEQSKHGRALYAREQALHVAESGLEYYRWFLAHNPGNLTNGTGQPGPYSYTVSDPEGGALGTASISVVGNSQCGQLQSIDITSVGRASSDPQYARTLFARYMRPSVAAYSYLLNTNVWAGSDRVITGPYFSNGGIRMDGSNNSEVLSAVSTWSCDSQYNCSPTQNHAPGVVGSGSGYALWKWPAASVDFAGMGISLASLKTYAQNGGGRYFGPADGNASDRGYHIIFKSNGTFDVYRVTSTISVPAYNSDVGYFTEYSIIKKQSFVGNYTIPPACSLIFVEDRVWVEGTIKGKVTLVAATPSDTRTSSDIYLTDNITYTTNDGSDGFTAIAESDVLIPLDSPDNMEIHGIFVAQGGHYGRNHYESSGLHAVPNTYRQYVLRSQLTTEGSVVSNTRTGTAWSNSGGDTISGYLNRIDAYDELQATNPPPFTPSASPDYSFVLWREQ